jgi:hypothetical protein
MIESLKSCRYGSYATLGVCHALTHEKPASIARLAMQLDEDARMYPNG